MKTVPDKFADAATRQFLPADCPYEKWKLLNHWWRMKVYSRNSIIGGIQQRFCEAARGMANPSDVGEFMVHPQAVELLHTLQSIPLDFDRLEESSEIASWHMQTLMHLQGVVYSIAPRLAKLLQATELRGVDCNLVRAPHQVMFVDIPKSAGLQVFNRDTGWHPVEGAYVVETDRVFDPELFKARKEPALGLVAGETFREIRVQIIGASKNPMNIWDDACFNFRIRMDEGSIQDAIDRELALVARLWGQHSKEARVVVEGLFNFVVNTLLYCTSVDADIVTRLNPAWEVLHNRAQKAKSPKKRQRIHKEMGKLDKQETQVIGSRLVVGKAPLDSSSSGSPSPEGSGRSLRMPHLVSGHWKGVWKGSTDPERAKEIGERRKLPKWIKPYPRGGLAEQIHTTYKVDLPDG